MTLSIISDNGAICENNLCYTDLYWSDTSADVHALQFIIGSSCFKPKKTIV